MICNFAEKILSLKWRDSWVNTIKGLASTTTWTALVGHHSSRQIWRSMRSLDCAFQDGEPIPEDDIQFVEDAVYGGLMMNLLEFRHNIKTSISTREQRAKAYV